MNTNHLFRTFLVPTLVLAAACGGNDINRDSWRYQNNDNSGGEDGSTGANSYVEHADAGVLAPSPDAGSQAPHDTKLGFVNTCIGTIYQYFLAPCSDTTWGPNQLASSLTVYDGISFRVDPGCWEMRAVLESGVLMGGHTEVQAGDQVYFTSCGLSDAVVPGLSYRGDLDDQYHSPYKAAAIRVENNCSSYVGKIAIAPCGTMDFMGLQLDPNEYGIAIRSGGNYTIQDVPVGCFDVRIDFNGPNDPRLMSSGNTFQGGHTYRLPLCSN